MRLQLALSTAWLAAIALLCWGLFRFALAQWRGPRRVSLRREALLAALVLYAGVVAAVTVIPERATTDNATRVNVVPLMSVMACVTGIDGPPEAPQFCVENVVGNVLLFMPFGALLPAVSRRFRPAAAVVFFALLVSASIEAVQLAERRIGVGRTVDVDDVLWNVIGACIGYRVVEWVTVHFGLRRP